ncbi:MAG: helix-turn-helix transcriptional regulator [Thermosynechococcaceae cyanobacterium]
MSIVLSAFSVGTIRWKLREVMAARKISNEDLARTLGKHPTTISRLKGKDFLPAIGEDEIEAIRVAINTLSEKSYGVCKLADLLLIED